MTSTYPTAVAALVEQVRELADREGAVPSRNRVMAEFRVGARKASDALAAFAEPTPPVADPVPGGADAVSPFPDPVPDRADPVSAPTDLGSIPPEPGSADTVREVLVPVESEQVSTVVDPGPNPVRRVRSWPLVLLALPAFVAIWSGWVGLGGLTGFGTIHPLPGIADGLTLNTAITLPIGVEVYAAYALNVWLGGHHLTARARRFAKWSALGALALGALGQVVFHLMTAAGMTAAPWPVTTLVSCLPVVVLGCGAALRHLVQVPDR